MWDDEEGFLSWLEQHKQRNREESSSRGRVIFMGNTHIGPRSCVWTTHTQVNCIQLGIGQLWGCTGSFRIQSTGVPGMLGQEEGSQSNSSISIGQQFDRQKERKQAQGQKTQAQ